MRQRRLWVVGRVAIVALLLGALIVSPALAASFNVEEPEEIEFAGTVVSVSAGETGCTLVVSVTTDEGETEYTVEAPAEFDCESVEEGDTVEVEGTLGEDVVVATKIVVESEDEEPEEIEFTGTVVSVSEGETGCILVVSVETDDGETEYTVEAPAEFDCESVEEGDTVEVEGTLDEDVVVATKIVVESEDEEAEEEDDDEEENAFCADSGLVHPVGMALATRYGVSYELVMSWFCDGAGFGQIMLALQTAKTTATDDTEDLSDAAGSCLLQREEGQGWGQIWQGLGLVGKGKKAAETQILGETEGNGKSNGHGKPPWAGRGRGKKK